MHQLQYEFEENSELKGVILNLSERISYNKVKIGIILDINPYWKAAYRVWEMGLEPWRIRTGERDGYNLLDYIYNANPSGGLFDFGWRNEFVKHRTSSDFSHRYEGGKMGFPEFPESFQPYMLRILAKPAFTPEEIEARRSLRDAAIQTAIPTIVQTEVPRLIAAPGDGISSGSSSGTLGGFLRDVSTKQTYAVTCGHVVSAGTVYCGASSVGTCRSSDIASPIPFPSGTYCTHGCTSMTHLDVAIIDVGTASVSNTAATIANTITNGDLVEMHGATSGKVDYEVGGWVVELNLAGSCWERLFAIHVPTAGIAPLSARFALHPLPRPGDSGAWLLRNQTEWAGMVVASGHMSGYALAADTIKTEASKEFNRDLDLF